MIWDSYEWKKYLRRLLWDLKRKIQEEGDEVPFIVERNIFIIAFTIRKLFDSHKITDKLASLEFSFRMHRKIGERHHDRSLHTADPEYWDLCSHTVAKMKIRDVCNEIIHSDILNWIGDEQQITAFFVASELRASKRLVQIDFETFTHITDLVISDSVDSISISFDETGKIEKRQLN
ncbi:hypothetical protein [Glycocaulis alkaliphilus]|nr:hypothetical protein [Glycocaulis alkaliphilus]GGB68753.1 hypothetical protein GCM10007417_05680 [Glycocaulis alkaliphilus]